MGKNENDINGGVPMKSENYSDTRLDALEGKAVLVVDDEPMIIKISQRHLQTLSPSCSVTGASCAKEAIQKIEDGLTPDIIISDMMMQDGTGKDLYDWLKANKPELLKHIFFVSGGVSSGSQALRQFYDNMIEKGYLLEKPFRTIELRGMITKVLSIGKDKGRLTSKDSCDNDDVADGQ